MKQKKYWLGPSSWSQWLLALFPFSILFNEAAKAHDIGYGIGGDYSNKKSVDNKFIDDMYKACIDSYNPFSWFFALFYYFMVVIFGRFYFSWRKE